MKAFLTNFMTQHKERLISVSSGIGMLAMGYVVGVPALILMPVAAGVACFPEVKALVNKAMSSTDELKSTLKEKIIHKTVTLTKRVSASLKNPKIPFALIATGITLGYLGGVSLPILMAAPFIMAPSLLQPIKNVTYLILPLGMIAYQVNRDPAQHLLRHLLNLTAIAGLIVGKNVIFPKIAAKTKLLLSNESLTNIIDLNDDSNSECESDDFSHEIGLDLDLNQAPLGTLDLIANEDLGDDSSDQDYLPTNRSFTSQYDTRSRHNLLPQQVVFTGAINNIEKPK